MKNVGINMKNVKCNWIIFAFLVALLIASITAAGLTINPYQPDFITILGLIPIFYFFSALPTFFFGIPIYFFVAKRGWLNLWSILMGGIAIGAIYSFILHLPSMPQMHDFVVTVPIGAVSALTFWLVWRGSRDNNTSA